MVKTRHSVETEESNDTFLSIPPRRMRRGQGFQEQMNGFDSDDSEVQVSPYRGRRYRPRTKDSAPDFPASSKIIKRTRTRSAYHNLVETDTSPDEPREEYDISGRRRRQTDHGDFVRRSSRQRKLMYDSLNQSMLEKHLMLPPELSQMEEQEQQQIHQSRRRRHCQEELLENTEQDIDQEGEEECEENQKQVDMYTLVKRERRKVKRDMYGIPVHEEGKSEMSGSDDESDSTEEDEDGDQAKPARSYFLREHKPRTILYEAPPIEPKKRIEGRLFGDSPPALQSSRRGTTSYRSPAHRSPRKVKRRRAAFHGSDTTSSSSSSSSSGDSSDDERRFERRKAKSMARARNRCRPMNFGAEDLANVAVRDRVKIGSSLADVDPMNIDREVNFESVGGLGKHIQSLKEMVVFPLLYPEVFERFKIAPPRGVLFYGPPGTGKTLVARALANECSTAERRVAFFMRKGADCLSKWVGESERQLRLLFDQAYQLRPSIIFFDEIDGLAPVRSSRQDQIHSSIVSTLLALMDGLDNRGEIVVIGATNRIDSIDPALRRPGRFDREFQFPLPAVEARKQILTIHTKEWNPKLSDFFLGELAEKCVGYCGADLKALCTEAALHALRRRYPQIYMTSDKLELDVSSICINAKDFHRAIQSIVPTSQRSVTSPGRSLKLSIQPLLQCMLDDAMNTLKKIFPPVLAQLASLDTTVQDPGKSGKDPMMKDLDLTSDDDEDVNIYQTSSRGGRSKNNSFPSQLPQGSFLNFSKLACTQPTTHRPRLLLCGHSGQGQSSHLGPAILHQLERLPVHVLDLPALFAVSAKTPEESCAQLFREARRTCPSIIYMPHIGQWWDVIADTTKATFLALLQDLDSTAPLLLLATSDVLHHQLPPEIGQLFSGHCGEIIQMKDPSSMQRREFFSSLFLQYATRPPTTSRQTEERLLEVLPKAKPPEPRKLTDKELKRLHEQEEATLRELRLFLRDIINKLGRDRKFNIFTKPVDVEDVPDYYEIIKNPMDLSTMMSKIDLHHYQTVKEFLEDICLICKNALEYNPDRDPSDRAIRHRACALRDTAHSMVRAELDPDFEKLCADILESRIRRGENPTKTAPPFYYTKPVQREGSGTAAIPSAPIPSDYPSRYSRRVRGMLTETESPSRELPQTCQSEAAQSENWPETNAEQHVSFQPRMIVKKVPIKMNRSNTRARQKMSPWCRPRRAKRYRKVIVYLDEEGRELGPQEEEQEISDHGANGEEERTEAATGAQGQTASSVDSETAETSINTKAALNTNCTDLSTSIASTPMGKVSNKVTASKPSTSVQENDSGVSSAPDSNGDSIDQAAAGASPSQLSTRKRKRSMSDMEAETTGCDVGASTQSDQTAQDTTDTASQPNTSQHSESCETGKQRQTRSQTQINQMLAKRPKFVVDCERLGELLETLVKQTAGYHVDRLEQIHSTLSQTIYTHRKSYDRTQLTQDLECEVDQLTSH